MAKTQFLQIRFTPEDRDRIWDAATADHLDPSTWARRIILQALSQREAPDATQQVINTDDETA